MDKLIDLYVIEDEKEEAINGLMMAYAICSRKLLESYDKNVIDIMEEIYQLMEKIKGR